jgi:mannose-6-phosphate isomerase-like protein (cupin superfamily)
MPERSRPISHPIPQPATPGGLPDEAAFPGAPSFPGATALTVLDVYDWVAPDGLRGGSAHVHLASTEGYLVLSGEGHLQTLSQRGYAATRLRPGECLWFTPGTIHRLVNEGGLRLAIVMQNAGLPEHGDAVLTFPPDVLADPAAYARAASLDADAGPEEAGQADGPEAAGRSLAWQLQPGQSLAEQALAGQARRRASLAIEGYLALRDQVADHGPAALDDFYEAALRLTAGQVPDWRERWHAGALATAGLTGEHLDEIAEGIPGHLAHAGVWRIHAPDGDSRGYGMCGRLTTYPLAQASQIL